ncbi:MAG: hypothetical protein ACXWM7_01975 [Parachlamydiaceae bacterium]
MIKEWLNWLNGGIAIVTVLLLLAAFFVAITTSTPSLPQPIPAYSTRNPSSGFELSQESYDAIGDVAFNLDSAPVTLQVPDLRKQLVYHGKNNRPDADPQHTAMNFAFVGSKIPTPIQPKTPTYLIYDKSQSRYDFSPNNQKTSIWIEVAPDGANASIKVRMKNDEGEIISTPHSHSTFSLSEKPFIRNENFSWEIGKQRVDGTLLARQRARWFGTDIFMERHGGKEYEHLMKKQRIDFEDANHPYSIYVKQGDTLIWNQDHWVVTPPGEQTIGKPLLYAKKMDDRIMHFEIWDAEGKTKVGLNLLKSNEPPPVNSLMQAFKFIGSRTRSKFVFEINKQRVILSPGDWLLQVDKGWKKISTPDEIDAYVDRKVTGLLFVLENVERREDRQILVGTLFNKSRTNIQYVEMSMDSGANLSPAPSGGNIPPPQPIIPKEELQIEEKVEGLELHPHTREDIHTYQKKLR